LIRRVLEKSILLKQRRREGKNSGDTWLERVKGGAGVEAGNVKDRWYEGYL
jgi:hypothetical protein